MSDLAIQIDSFRPEDAQPLVSMWRRSFEWGVGMTDPHPVEEQLEYLRREILPRYRVLLARINEQIAGFIAFDAQSIAQLYVDPVLIGRGIGSRLLGLAKAESSGKLWLYTFQRNERAQRFYERHGFRVVATGFEPSWQLADIKYEWSAPEVQQAR